jgi:hypothetical protein
MLSIGTKCSFLEDMFLNSQPDASRVWSLLRIMLDFDLQKFLDAFSNFQAFESMIIQLAVTPNVGPLAEDREINDVVKVVEALSDQCERIDFFESAMQAQALIQDILNSQMIRDHTYSRIEVRMKVLKESVFRELYGRKFLWIRPGYAAFVDQNELFGPEVNWVFPEAKEDIREAGNCIAVDSNTAAVFHLMRVLEHGLVLMAENVGITELGVENWHNIIEQIESKIRNAQKKLPRGAEKTERLQFLSEAAKEFTYFKDGWRNHVSHNRSKYDANGAFSIFIHVLAFMKHLSVNLGDKP